MFVLISGTLFRDPVARMSKADKQFTTALLRPRTPTDATWCNIVAFDTAVQSELLRLAAGDNVSVQGSAKLGTFTDKAGVHRASFEIIAAHILALRQPKPKSKRECAPALAPDYDDTLDF